ncbi:hypothetical protein CK203_063280 [Vitis vinifera]|uniref:Integrase catalytic domain-containing protein n=1 Tax=Vitis vinifera TaxID=29760 RepID=A0A438G673_VITVI|nr:hypothetical protein CK203_063280 [Vitis vinifera]
MSTTINKKIKVFHSDEGREFINFKLSSHFLSARIIHQVSCPYTQSKQVPPQTCMEVNTRDYTETDVLQPSTNETSQPEIDCYLPCRFLHSSSINLHSTLELEFAMKDLGQIHHFLASRSFKHLMIGRGVQPHGDPSLDIIRFWRKSHLLQTHQVGLPFCPCTSALRLLITQHISIEKQVVDVFTKPMSKSDKVEHNYGSDKVENSHNSCYNSRETLKDEGVSMATTSTRNGSSTS